MPPAGAPSPTFDLSSNIHEGVREHPVVRIVRKVATRYCRQFRYLLLIVIFFLPCVVPESSG